MSTGILEQHPAWQQSDCWSWSSVGFTMTYKCAGGYVDCLLLLIGPCNQPLLPSSTIIAEQSSLQNCSRYAPSVPTTIRKYWKSLTWWWSLMVDERVDGGDAAIFGAWEFIWVPARQALRLRVTLGRSRSHQGWPHMAICCDPSRSINGQLWWIMVDSRQNMMDKAEQR